MTEKLRLRVSRDQPLGETALDQFSDDLCQCKDGAKFVQQEFAECVSRALQMEKLQSVSHRIRRSKAKRVEGRCCKVFKVLWILLLCFLAFCLLAAGFKPVAFHVHKVSTIKLLHVF